MKQCPPMTGRARQLRRDMTPEERHLWYDFLRHAPVMVHRQKVIGPYIADFYIAQSKIVIEVDGSQHYTEAGLEYDRERDAYLQGKGLQVLRYSNRDINQNFQAVCQDILEHIKSSP